MGCSPSAHPVTTNSVHGMPWWRSTGAALATTLRRPSSKVSASSLRSGAASTCAGVPKENPSSAATCRWRSNRVGETSLTPHERVPTEW